MATHFSILAWKIPRTEEPGRLQFMELQRVGHDWETTFSLSPFSHISSRQGISKTSLDTYPYQHIHSISPWLFYKIFYPWASADLLLTSSISIENTNRKWNENYVKYPEWIELYLTFFEIIFYQYDIRIWEASLDSPFLLCKPCLIKPRGPLELTTSKLCLMNNTILHGKS